MGNFYLIILQIIFFFTSFVNCVCPSAFSILPCTCEINKEGQTAINCEHIENSDDLVSAIFAAKKQKMSMVQLKDVSVMFFPDELFIDTKVQILKIQDSSIFSLGDSDSTFVGLEESLNTLEVVSCNFVNNWRWSELSKMKKLRYLTISESELLELPNLNFPQSNIETLNFRGNLIHELHDHAFSNITQLKKLTLDKNDIRVVNRSMLPIPAKYLEAIGLSFNNLKWLPIDAFVQMPALRYLYLGGNPLQVLNEEVFKPVWSQLNMVLFQENPLICDCYLAWLITAKRAKIVLIGGACNSPEDMKGTKLTQIPPAYFQSCL